MHSRTGDDGMSTDVDRAGDADLQPPVVSSSPGDGEGATTSLQEGVTAKANPRPSGDRHIPPGGCLQRGGSPSLIKIGPIPVHQHNTGKQK